MGAVELSVLKTEILNAIRATESEETADQARKIYEKYRARNSVPYMSWKDHTPLTVVPRKMPFRLLPGGANRQVGQRNFTSSRLQNRA